MVMTTEQKLLFRCKRCEHQWEDVEHYPVRCPECGSIQWRYVRDKKVLKDFANMTQNTGQWIKCPHCGGEALANYKSNRFMGKCASTKCHRVFSVTQEQFASPQEYGAYLAKVMTKTKTKGVR